MTRFSVIVPTHERRAQVLRTVAALGRQTRDDFELIVVVDGSRDGSAEALRAAEGAAAPTVLETENRGAAAARNTGAETARGEILLFLDDDMEADPGMLAEHDRSHRDGVDIVLGDIPLDPSSPANLLSKGVGIWAESRRRRLSADDAEVSVEDLLTGQISISRENYQRMGGFDAGLTRGGLFGGEDIDFGHRAKKLGLRIEFNPDAISRQRYDVGPGEYLRRSYEVGRSEEELLIKHPEEAAVLANGPTFHSRRSRWLLAPFVPAPAIFSWPLRAGAAGLVSRGHEGRGALRAFFAVRTLEHLRGARATRRRLNSGRVTALAYHSISARADDPAIGRWTVPPALFADHLREMGAAGFAFVDLDAVAAALKGRRSLPRRAVLLTFDDGYVDLLANAKTSMAAHGAPGVVFAVSGEIGGSNSWDRGIGAPEMSLLDAEGLLDAARSGIEVGSHTVTHTALREVDATGRGDELSRSADQLEAIGLPRPRALSYPYGDYDSALAGEVAAAGYTLAFTIDAGAIEAGSNPMALPRVEVLSSDSGRDIRLKVRTAGWPDRWRRRLLKLRGVEL